MPAHSSDNSTPARDSSLATARPTSRRSRHPTSACSDTGHGGVHGCTQWGSTCSRARGNNSSASTRTMATPSSSCWLIPVSGSIADQGRALAPQQAARRSPQPCAVAVSTSCRVCVVTCVMCQVSCTSHSPMISLTSLWLTAARIYYRALAQFTRVLFIANGVGDLTVPYCTAAAERHDPFVDYEAGRLGLVVHDHIVRNVFSPQEEDEVDAIVGETLVPAAPTRPWLPPVFYLPYRPVRYVSAGNVRTSLEGWRALPYDLSAPANDRSSSLSSPSSSPWPSRSPQPPWPFIPITRRAGSAPWLCTMTITTAYSASSRATMTSPGTRQRSRVRALPRWVVARSAAR